MLLSARSWLAMLMVVGTMAGCCNPDVKPVDWVNIALRRYPLTTYINPDGEYLQLMVIDSGFDSRPSSDYVNDRGDCKGYDPRTYGLLLPSTDRPMMKYSQSYNYDIFSIMGMKFQPTYGAMDSTLVLQSTVFEHCRYLSHTDSLGITEELALSPLYGLVLFSKSNAFRWERVLEE
jgi:hypothetical protein